MSQQLAHSAQTAQQNWLKRYYFIRAGFSIAWIAAVLLAKASPGVSVVLLVAYPAWDALANFIDARRSGGIQQNTTQQINIVASSAVALALAIALPDMNRALAVFGVWAILAGLLQLGTAVRRWKSSGAQWAMVLSGAQSALAGAFFIVQAQAPAVPTISSLAGYAGFGAFYFLISALVLSWNGRAARA